MKNLSFILLIIPIIVLTACKKKVAQPVPVETPESASEYFPLSVGNYWIYEQFQTDTNNVIKSLNIFDSVYVVSVSTINGKATYTVCEQDHWDPKPDSLKQYVLDGHQLFGPTNNALLSTTNFSTNLETFSFKVGADTIYTYTTKMKDKDLLITVKAGTYKTINRQTIFSQISAYCPTLKRFPIFNKYYTKSIGLIYERMLGYCQEDGDTRRHRELVRYHIK